MLVISALKREIGGREWQNFKIILGLTQLDLKCTPVPAEESQSDTLS